MASNLFLNRSQGDTRNFLCDIYYITECALQLVDRPTGDDAPMSGNLLFLHELQRDYITGTLDFEFAIVPEGGEK